MINNKKGDVSITILVIGVIAVCALAIFSFINSSFNEAQSFTGVSLMEELNAKIDAYYFYQLQGLNSEQIKSILEEDKYVQMNNNQLYLEKTKFKLFGKNEFLFSVEYVFP